MAYPQQPQSGWSWSDIMGQITEAIKNIQTVSLSKQQITNQRLSAQGDFLKSLGIVGQAAAMMNSSEMTKELAKITPEKNRLDREQTKLELYKGTIKDYLSDKWDKNLNAPIGIITDSGGVFTKPASDMYNSMIAKNFHVVEHNGEIYISKTSDVPGQDDDLDPKNIAATVTIDPDDFSKTRISYNRSSYVYSNGRPATEFGTPIISRFKDQNFAHAAVKKMVGDYLVNKYNNDLKTINDKLDDLNERESTITAGNSNLSGTFFNMLSMLGGNE